MPDHTVKAFTEELDALTQEVQRMGGLAEAAVNDSLIAITRRDTTLAQAVIERDVKIDAAQTEIERIGRRRSRPRSARSIPSGRRR